MSDDLHKPLSILLAEDDAGNQKLIKTMLAGEKHSLDIVGNGQLVLDMMEQNDYDVILMDIQMPVMSGIEAAICLRENGVSIPIIAVSANTLEENIEQCLAVGMNCFLSKPVKKGELLGAIHDWCYTKRAAETPLDCFYGKSKTVESEFEIDARTLSFDDKAAFAIFGEDLDLLQEMLGEFLQDQPGKIAGLTEALASNDLERIQQCAHALKGSSGQVGAERLRKLCHAAEHYSRHQESDKLGGLIAAIGEEFQALQKALESHSWQAYRALCGSEPC